MRYILCMLASGLCASGPSLAANLIANGDFTAGATGFSSTYSAIVSATTANQGSYAVTTNPAALCSSCFLPIGDHTTGTGNMLFVDSAGTNPGHFWSQTFSVAADTSYDFSVWATSLGATGALPSLRVAANGVTILGATQLPNATGVTATTWNKYGSIWSSGSATSVTLELFSANLGYQYNDLAIDDVSFAAVAAPAVPEPATWMMLIGGLALIGACMRRRTVAVAFS